MRENTIQPKSYQEELLEANRPLDATELANLRIKMLLQSNRLDQEFKQKPDSIQQFSMIRRDEFKTMLDRCIVALLELEAARSKK